jgi:lariat debranching enzyme
MVYSFNFLNHSYYGGWAAQNLYFLGWAGVIKFGGVRIAGASGIYKPNHYTCGHYEKAPYSQSDLRSIYHVRQYDIRKLGLLKTPIDIMLTHDWPRGIEQYGDVQKLLRVKKFFREEVGISLDVLHCRNGH